MKKNVKGFTLIELIVVMAILVILMAGIMNMFKPIRETYVDATLYESQRTVQNGVIQYVTESVKYSTDLGIYSTSGSTAKSNVKAAVDEFTKEYIEANGVSSADQTAVTTYIAKNAEVIIIDNKTKYNYNGKDYTGRILRRKVDGTTSITSTSDTNASEFRMALGRAYYGETDLDITLKVSLEKEKKDDGTEVYLGKAPDGIGIDVASTTSYAARENFMTNDAGAKIIKTSGTVICRNQSEVGGLFDADTAVTLDVTQPQKTSADANVYIVYLNNKVEV